MPAKPPARRRADSSAGPVIRDERVVPPPADKPAETRRQTLDLPVGDYERLHDQVNDYARAHRLRTREFNAQRVLRTLVARLLADDQLADEVFRTSAQVSSQ